MKNKAIKKKTFEVKPVMWTPKRERKREEIESFIWSNKFKETFVPIKIFAMNYSKLPSQQFNFRISKNNPGFIFCVSTSFFKQH